jgi:hypothetical protein
MNRQNHQSVYWLFFQSNHQMCNHHLLSSAKVTMVAANWETEKGLMEGRCCFLFACILRKGVCITPFVVVTSADHG